MKMKNCRCGRCRRSKSKGAKRRLPGATPLRAPQTQSGFWKGKENLELEEPTH